MKKRMSVFISFLVALSTIASVSPLSAFAYSPNSIEYTIKTGSDKEITVVIPENLRNDIKEEDIQSIISCNDLSDGDRITIVDAGLPTVESSTITPPAEPNAITYRTTITGRGSTEFKIQDYFVISAAKGQITTLTSTFKRSIVTSFGTGIQAPFTLTAELQHTVTAEYTVSHEFSGPPEGSAYNSREFRVQFYAHDLYWKQEQLSPAGTVVATRSGTGCEPTKYLLYSIDHKV